MARRIAATIPRHYRTAHEVVHYRSVDTKPPPPPRDSKGFTILPYDTASLPRRQQCT